MWEGAKSTIDKFYSGLKSQNYSDFNKILDPYFNSTILQEINSAFILLDNKYGKIEEYKIEGFSKEYGLGKPSIAQVYITIKRNNTYYFNNDTIILVRKPFQNKFLIVGWHTSLTLNTTKDKI